MVSRREARKLDREDETPYLVVKGNGTRYRVTGYTSAKTVAGRDPQATISMDREARS